MAVRYGNEKQLNNAILLRRGFENFYEFEEAITSKEKEFKMRYPNSKIIKRRRKKSTCRVMVYSKRKKQKR